MPPYEAKYMPIIDFLNGRNKERESKALMDRNMSGLRINF